MPINGALSALSLDVNLSRSQCVKIRSYLLTLSERYNKKKLVIAVRKS
jgi:hypothetical protein